MQRKQQVGECWVCVIFFACVCVGESDLTTASNDPNFLRSLCRVRFPKGGQVWPPLVTRSVRGSGPKFFLGRFLLFLAVF